VLLLRLEITSCLAISGVRKNKLPCAMFLSVVC
jgi:hypothetical protein